MATGKAVIRGRSGTSTSGKKVSVYSPQYKQTTGSSAAKRGTTSYSVATSQLTDAQKQVASTLGLSKSQVLALSSTQISQINANLSRYGTAYVSQLKKMYGDVSTDKLIRSGQSGLSKLQTQKYVQAQASKRYGSDKSVKVLTAKEFGKVADSTGRSLYASYYGKPGAYDVQQTTIRTYNDSTGKYEVSASVFSDPGSYVRTAGDYQFFWKYSQKTTFNVSASEKSKISAARKYILKTAGGSASAISAFYKQTDLYTAAKTKISYGMSSSAVSEIKKARNSLISESKTPGKLREYFAWVDSQPYTGLSEVSFASWSETYGKEDKAALKAYGTTEFKTVDQLKAAKVDGIYNEISGYVSSLNSVLSKFTLPSLLEKPIEKVDTRLSKSKTYTGLKGDIISSVEASETLSTLAGFGKGMYEDIKKKPVTKGAEYGSYAVVGAAFGAGTKVLGAASKVGSKALLGGEAATTPILKLLGYSGKRNIPVISKIAAEHLPVIVVDSYFLRQIVNAYSEGSKGSNPVTEENLKLTESLAVMAPFTVAGSRVIKRVGKTKTVSKISKDFEKGLTDLIKDESAEIRRTQRLITENATRQEVEVPTYVYAHGRLYQEGEVPKTGVLDVMKTETTVKSRASARTRASARSRTKRGRGNTLVEDQQALTDVEPVEVQKVLTDVKPVEVQKVLTKSREKINMVSLVAVVDDVRSDAAVITGIMNFIRNPVKVDLTPSMAIKPVYAVATSSLTAVATDVKQVTALVNAVSNVVKQSAVTRVKVSAPGAPRLRFEQEPIFPPYGKKKTSKKPGEVRKSYASKTKRVRKNVIGSFESIFGSGSKPAKRTKSKKRSGGK